MDGPPGDLLTPGVLPKIRSQAVETCGAPSYPVYTERPTTSGRNQFCAHQHLESVVTTEYERGYAEGYAAREAEFEGLERVADHWYFRALNPNAKTPDQKMIESIIDGMEANEERRKRFAELDAEEQRRFDEARTLIAEGMEDIDVAKKVGLFV